MDAPMKKQLKGAQDCIISNVRTMADCFDDGPDFHSSIEEMRTHLRTLLTEEKQHLKAIDVEKAMNVMEVLEETGEVPDVQEMFNERMAKEKDDPIDFDKNEVMLTFESEVAKVLGKIKALRAHDEKVAARRAAEAAKSQPQEEIDSE